MIRFVFFNFNFLTGIVVSKKRLYHNHTLKKKKGVLSDELKKQWNCRDENSSSSSCCRRRRCYLEEGRARDLSWDAVGVAAAAAEE